MWFSTLFWVEYAVACGLEIAWIMIWFGQRFKGGAGVEPPSPFPDCPAQCDLQQGWLEPHSAAACAGLYCTAQLDWTTLDSLIACHRWLSASEHKYLLRRDGNDNIIIIIKSLPDTFKLTIQGHNFNSSRLPGAVSKQWLVFRLNAAGSALVDDPVAAVCGIKITHPWH